MKKLTPNRKLYLLRRGIREILNRKKRKNKRYNTNYRTKRQLLKRSPEFHIIKAPINLNLKFEDSVEVLKFIRDIKRYGDRGYFIDLKLENVQNIDVGAIIMLLSVISDLEHKKIFFRGSKPLDEKSRDVLELSGFFEHMNGTVSKHNIKSKNKILKTGNKDTHQKDLIPEIHKAIETVWGTKARCPLLYGGLGEMMRNTCDHAFSDLEHIMWHLGISHYEDTQIVKFSFVDNGEGIISTYSKKGFLDKIKSYFKDNSELLATAFKNGVTSRTGLPWRGKGLPTIYEMYSENIITNLIVITNNVYIDFDRKIFKTIKINFSGTYYYWEINNECSPSFFKIKDN